MTIPGPKNIDAIPVLLDRHGTVHRCAQDQAVDELLRPLHAHRCLVVLLLDDGERRLVRRRPRLHVLLELREAPLGLLERQHVLLRFDRGNELVAARVELAAPDVESRREHRDVVLRLLHRGVGLHLDDFLFRFGQLRTRLLQGVHLVGGIELHDDVAALDRHPCRLHLDDAEHAADGRRDERHGAAGAQLAVRVDGDLQRTLRDERGRHGLPAFRQTRHARRRSPAPTASTATAIAGPTRSTARHSDLLIISGDGRLVAMRSPGSMPDATTACSLPRFEICTRRSWNSDPSSS